MSTRLSRRKITDYIASQLIDGADSEVIATQLAAYLIDTRRTSEAELFIRDIDYYLAERGVVLANIVSAYALSEATQKAITEMITQTTGARTIELSQHIDAAVLGGVRIDIPGRQLDGTIARRLHQLTTQDN